MGSLAAQQEVFETRREWFHEFDAHIDKHDKDGITDENLSPVEHHKCQFNVADLVWRFFRDDHLIDKPVEDSLADHEDYKKHEKGRVEGNQAFPPRDNLVIAALQLASDALE